MAEILPHTQRFVLIFNKLKLEKKLPSNSELASNLGLNSGNTLTEIKNGRQNISLEVLQKFCELYGKENGFGMDYFVGTLQAPVSAEDPELYWKSKAEALEIELALLKSFVYGMAGNPRPYEVCVSDIENRTKEIMKDLRQTGE